MRLRSLQLRLAIHLATVYVAAIAMVVSFFIYQAYNAAASFHRPQELAATTFGADADLNGSLLILNVFGFAETTDTSG
jgi:hypothetical protein